MFEMDVEFLISCKKLKVIEIKVAEECCWPVIRSKGR